MPSVSLIDPYSQQAEEIARRQRMAQALQESGSQVIDLPTTPGVSVSPYAGLAKVFQQMYGAYQDKQARKDYAALQDKYRTDYNTQFEQLAEALASKGVEGSAGTNEIPYEPAQVEKIYGTKPKPVMGSGYGSGMLMPDQVIGEKVIKPEVPYQAAVAPVEARPAGYISPDLLKGINIPEVKQLAMAKYLAQFEPKQIKLGQNERLLGQTGNGPLTELQGVSTTPKVLEPKWEATVQKINGVDTPGWINVNAGADKAASTFVAGGKPEKIAAHWEATTQKVNGKDVPGWINLNAADKTASFVAGAKPTETKATEPKWEKGVKIVDGKNVYGWYDLTAPNYEASFKAGAVPPAGDTKLIEVTRGGKVYYENPAIVDVAARQAAAIEKEVVPVKKIRMDITNPDGSTKTILTDENDPKFKEGFVTKGPNYANITEVNEKGETVIRQVEQNDPILKTGYVKPLEGFFGQLQALGVPIKDWRNNPALAEMVNRYFVKGVGGSDIEAVAGYDLQKMEVLARLAEQGIKVPQAVLDKLNIKATPGLLGGAQSSNAAPAAANGTKAAPLPLPSKTSDYKTGQYYLTNKGVLLFNGSKFVD